MVKKLRINMHFTFKFIIIIFAGPLRPEYTVKYIAVSLIFFNSGLSLKSEVAIIVKIMFYS